MDELKFNDVRETCSKASLTMRLIGGCNNSERAFITLEEMFSAFVDSTLAGMMAARPIVDCQSCAVI
jgi:hypothetical protein